MRYLNYATQTPTARIRVMACCFPMHNCVIEPSCKLLVCSGWRRPTLIARDSHCTGCMQSLLRASSNASDKLPVPVAVLDISNPRARAWSSLLNVRRAIKQDGNFTT